MKSTTLPCGRTVYYRSPAALKVLSREFFDDCAYEREDVLLRDGDCIFDVGANIGLYLLQLNSSLKKATVFCFEPLPATFELLQKNASLNDRLGAVLCNYGLGETSGEFRFQYLPRMDVGSTMCGLDSPDTRRSGRDSVFNEIVERSRIGGALLRLAPRWSLWPLLESLRRWSNSPRSVNCQVRTLSDVIDEHNLERIDLLKVDVEGVEEGVLGGIRDDHWSRIQQLVIETHFGREQADRIAAKLIGRGFEICRLPGNEDLPHLHLVIARRATVDPSRPISGLANNSGSFSTAPSETDRPGAR
jgi:nonribosomal peptide synthetase DhbF